MLKRSRSALSALILGLTLAVIGLSTTVLTGCGTVAQSVGQSAPVTAEDHIQYAKAALTGINRTIRDSVNDGTFTRSEAQSYLDKSKAARAQLRNAEDIVDGITPGTETQALSIARAAVNGLKILSDELRKRLPPAKTTALKA